MTEVLIKLLKGWNGSVAGTVLDLDRGQASMLVIRQIAERVFGEPEPEPEPDAYPAVLQKAEKPVADKAIHKAPKNKRR